MMKVLRKIKLSWSPGLLLLVTVGFFSTPSPGMTGEVPQAFRAPVSPAFASQLDKPDVRILRSFTEEGHPLGYFPPPVTPSFSSSNVSRTAVVRAAVTALPATFDLRTRGRVTEVRDQGGCGSCWTFATNASLESWLLRRTAPETWDFSEQDMNRNHGFDLEECEGGNQSMSTAYLARGSGPVKETDAPYPYRSTSSATGLPVMKQVQEVIYLPNRAGFTDNDTIKWAVKQKGALYCSFQYEGNFYNPDHFSYWYPMKSYGNHAVAIVGWDDRFPASRFKPVAGKYPEGDGAFIVRNSWGSAWGDEGYFYISYYDRSLANFASYIKARQPTIYSMVYEYDPLGWIRSAGFGSDTAWFANVFTANYEDTLIRGVGFYTQQPNCPYEIRIYKNVQDGEPVSGKLIKTLTGIMPTAGFHTVRVSPAAKVVGGKRFSVVVKLITPGYGFPVAIEEPIVGYSSAAKAYSGQSFMSPDGSNWSDITGWDRWENSNVCLKAFASRASP